jgi:hypothetical protein
MRERVIVGDLALLKEGDEMFSLIKTLGVEMFLRKEAGAFAVAFLIAEFLYKFKSFALECLAFLATWYVLSFIQSLVIREKPRPEQV